MTAPLILFRLQCADKLGFLFCQRTAAFSQIMDTPACQHFPNSILPVFLRKGAHTDIALLARMAERDVFPAGNSVTGLLHERIKALKGHVAFFDSAASISRQRRSRFESFQYRPASGL